MKKFMALLFICAATFNVNAQETTVEDTSTTGTKMAAVDSRYVKLDTSWAPLCLMAESDVHAALDMIDFAGSPSAIECQHAAITYIRTDVRNILNKIRLGESVDVIAAAANIRAFLALAEFPDDQQWVEVDCNNVLYQYEFQYNFALQNLAGFADQLEAATNEPTGFTGWVIN